MVERPKRRTLGDEIYYELRKDIVSLKLEPGAMIFENELSNQFEVSRTPVRQALFILSKEQLVNILPQRGAQVAYLSKKKFLESQKLREIIESYAFVEAATKWDASAPFFIQLEKELNESIENQSEATKRGEYITFVYEDEVFHNKILALSENDTLIEVINNLRAHLNRFRYLEVLEAKHEEISVSQHKQLIELLKANNTEQIEDHLIHHLKTLEAKRVEIFDKYAHYFKD